MQNKLSLEELFSNHNDRLTEDTSKFHWEEVTEESLVKLGVPKDFLFKKGQPVTFYSFDTNTIYEVKSLEDYPCSTKLFMRKIKIAEEFKEITINK